MEMRRDAIGATVQSNRRFGKVLDFRGTFYWRVAAMNMRILAEDPLMAEPLNGAGLSGAAVVVPIYSAMLLRAGGLAQSGARLEAADMLTTAAETMRRFEHPAATRIADLARDLLGDAPLIRSTGRLDGMAFSSALFYAP
jgi:hypothetical protein